MNLYGERYIAAIQVELYYDAVSDTIDVISSPVPEFIGLYSRGADFNSKPYFTKNIEPGWDAKFYWMDNFPTYWRMSDASYSDLNTGEVINGGKIKFVPGDAIGDET